MAGELIAQKLKRRSTYLTCCVAGIGLIGLSGWLFDVAIVKHPVQGTIALNPVTALDFIVLAIAFFLLTAYRPSANKLLLGSLLAIIPISIGVVTLLDLFFHFPIQIDQFVFKERLLQDALTNIPSRVSANAALDFMLAGTSLIIMTRTPERAYWYQWISLTVGSTAAFSLLGYIYRVPEFYGELPFFPMSPATALAFLLFAAALLLANSNMGFMRQLTTPSAWNLVARYLLPTGLLLPVVFGYVRLWGAWKHLFSTEFGVALLVMSFVALSLVAVWFIVSGINKMDVLEKTTGAELLRLNNELTVANERLIFVNEEMFSTNEELTSGNEELTVLNEQLESALQMLARQKDEQLNRVLDSSNDVIWSFDLSGNGQNYLSRSAERIYGEPLDLLIQRPQFWLERLHPGDKAIKRESQQRLERDGITECTYRINLPGGTRWIHDRLRLIRDDSGKPQRLEGIATDVTSIKDAEGELDRERNLLRSLIDNIPDYIFVKDDQLRHIINNKATVELVGGGNEAETLGKTGEDYSGDLGADYRRDDEYVFSSGQSIINKEEVVLSQSGPIAVLTTKVPLKDDSGNVIALIGISRDVTEIRKQEAILNTYRGNLEIIFSNSFGTFLLLDQNGQVVLFNRAFAEFIGDVAGIVPKVGMSFTEVVIPHRRAEAQALFDHAIRGEKVTAEAEFTSRAGRKLYHLLRYEPTISEGKVTHVSIAAIDITDRKDQEDRLKESEANLTSILNGTLDGLMLLNKEFKVVMINDSYRRMARVTSGRDIDVGTSLFEIVPAARHEGFKEMLDKVKAGETVEYEVKYDIESVKEWFNVAITPVLAGVGEFLGYCVTTATITDRKNAESLVRSSEERFRALVENSEDLSIITDFGGGVLYVSANLPHVLGHEDLSMGTAAILHPDDSALTAGRIAALRDNPGKAFPFTLRMRHRDGTWRWMEGTATNLTHLESIKGIVSIFRDVTQRKAMEDDLRKAASTLSEFQSAIFRSSIVSVANPHGDITFVNENFIKISGYTSDELVGQNHRIINSGYHPRSFWIGMWKTISSGGIWRQEVRNKAKNGSYYWVDTFVMPFVDDKGNVREFLSIRNDITQRKKNEEEILSLNISLADFQDAINGSSIVSMANKKGDITFVNDNFVKISGYNREELIGRNHRIINSGHHSPEFWVEMWKTIARGDIWREEVKNKAKDGSYYWVDTFVMPFLDEDGKIREFLSIRNDITDRKKNLEELKTIEGVLREYNNRYEILSKATNDVIWDWDMIKDSVTYNHGMQTVLGYGESEVALTSGWWDQRFHPDDHDRAMKEMQAAFARRLPTWDCLYRYRAADGTYKHIHDRAYIVYGTNGEPVRMIGAMQDITEQTLSLEEIKKLSLVASKTDNAVIITDGQARIEWTNDGFTRLFGYTVEEAIGRHPYELMEGPETDKNVSARMLEKLFKLETVTEELLNYSKSGRAFWIRISITPILDESGNLKNFVSILSDISEQKTYERDITLIAHELASLIENANVPIFGVSQKRGIVEWNRVCTELTGYSREEVFSTNPLQRIIVRESWNRFDEMISKVLTGESISNLEIPIISKSRERLILLVSASPGREGPEGEGTAIIVAQNISELTEYRFGLEKKVEERTRDLNLALKKEKELVEMKSKFVSIASHEFRTPLSSISLAAGFIRRYKQRLNPEEIDHKLKSIETQVDHMSYLLDDVLTIGKSEAGVIQVNRSRLSVVNVIETLIREVTQSTGGTHRIEYGIECERDTFMGDEKLMRSIVINLLTNAIKFSPAAGRVELSVSCTQKAMHLKVRDFGIGIPAEDRDKLFESFYRGGNVSTISGTGLGLSIVKKAVDLLSGEIRVESELGKGTVFELTIPLADE